MRRNQPQKRAFKPVSTFRCEHCNTLVAACRQKDIEIKRMHNKIQKLMKARYRIVQLMEEKKIDRKDALETIKLFHR